MKKAICIAVIGAGMMLMPCMGIAQAAADKPVTAPATTTTTPAIPADQQPTKEQLTKHFELGSTDAQKSYDTMKTLAGIWLGSWKSNPAQPGTEDKPEQVSMRVTSSGNALMHEMKPAGAREEPSHSGTITMFYLEDDRLTLTHYCDLGNRPRMVGKVSPDGKKVEFDFLDVGGGTQHGYMNHAVFNIIDANHHTEDWSYVQPGGQSNLAHFDLQRTK